MAQSSLSSVTRWMYLSISGDSSVLKPSRFTVTSWIVTRQEVPDWLYRCTISFCITPSGTASHCHNAQCGKRVSACQMMDFMTLFKVISWVLWPSEYKYRLESYPWVILTYLGNFILFLQIAVGKLVVCGLVREKREDRRKKSGRPKIKCINYQRRRTVKQEDKGFWNNFLL